MSLELGIFLVVAIVAIASAAFMLLTRNAVHSALFLVVNFACVAFFYLLLNAPFLAMIQITVYAGAIMVLFMFVIMLLGAEKLGSQPAHYRWLAPIGAILTGLFLVIALFVVVQGNVGLLKAAPPNPQLRVVHALPGSPTLDVYMNDTRALASVAYTGATPFGQVLPGDYVLALYPSCTQPAASPCADPIATKAKSVLSKRITLKENTTTTLVLLGDPKAPQFVAVPTDLSTLNDDNTFRLQAVNATPGLATVSLLNINPLKANSTDPNDNHGELPLLSNIAFGQVGTVNTPLPKGSYSLVWARDNDRLAPLSDFVAQGKTSELVILVQETTGSGVALPLTLRATPVPTQEAFGSPQAIGQSLLSTYLLPFELVSLLLLAAMVGAIILTREDVVRRVRRREIVTEGALRINRATSAATTPANPETSGD
ncbi:MAG TPA: NADH-quinone oxidoreductase subunit J [Aggregatilineales bacterium]|nr:NADH-quinone oxidoreductase subunit J [Aggregatilineales bacterium]